jgi:hypothetical protein
MSGINTILSKKIGDIAYLPSNYKKENRKTAYDVSCKTDHSHRTRNSETDIRHFKDYYKIKELKTYI